MSDAYLKRLEDAVRNAHKAMSVLKQEIADLKQENALLKSKLSLHSESQEETWEEEIMEPVLTQRANESVSDNEDILNQDTEVTSAVAIAPRAKSILKTGWTNSSELSQYSFNKDDPVKKWTSNVKNLFKLVSRDNVHRCGHELSPYPARMNARTVVDTITTLTSEHEGSSFFTAVDLLAVLCASIATLTSEGLFKFEEMWTFLVNSFFADMRNLNHSPLYALQTGDYSHVTIPSVPVIANQEKDTTAAVTAVATAGTSDIAEVAKLFDFSDSDDSSSSDEDNAVDSLNKPKDHNADGIEGDDHHDNAFRDAEEADSEFPSSSSNDLDDDWMHNLDSTVMDVEESKPENVTNQSSNSSSNNDDENLQRSSLVVAGKLYLVIQLCVKLSMKAALIDLLQDVAITSSAGSVYHTGIIEGLVEVLKICESRRYLGSSLKSVESLCHVCTNCIAWAEKQSTTLGQCALDLKQQIPALNMISSASVGVDVQMDHTRLETVGALRRVGFWRSIIELSATQFDSKGHIFELMGFQRLEVQAQHFLTLLSNTSSLTCLSSSSVAEKEEVVMSLMELIHSPCYGLIRDGLTSALSITTEEESRALDLFRIHWSTVLDTSVSNEWLNQCTKALQLLECLIVSITSGEYDALSFGWKTGVTGFGMSTKERLLNRLEVGMSTLKKVPEISQFFHSNAGGSSSDVALLRINWLKYCSATDGELIRAADFVDRIINFFHTNSEVTPSAHVNHIVGICNEIVSLVAISSVERFMYLSGCCVRSLLSVAQDLTLPNGNDTTFAALCSQCSRFLYSLPPPFGGLIRSEITFEMLSAEHALRTKRIQLIPQTIHDKVSRNLPAMVINLDRRSDRWNKILQLGDACQLLPLRIPAVDGLHLQSKHGSSSSQDKRLLIPETDVTQTWDSTENACFDPGCAINEQTLMSESERACAASHLSVWRLIVAMTTKASNNQANASGSISSASTTVRPDLLRQCRYFYSARQLHNPSLHPCVIDHSKPNNKTKGKTSKSASPEDFYLIMEDDAHVTPLHQTNFQHALCDILLKLPADADILYLGGAVPKGGTKFKSTVTGNGLFCRVNYVWQLHAYLVKRSTVDTLLSHLPINGPVDNFVASLILHGDLTAYMLRKSLVIQSGNSLKNRRFDSNIRHSGRLRSNEKNLHLESHDRKRSKLN